MAVIRFKVTDALHHFLETCSKAEEHIKRHYEIEQALAGILHSPTPQPPRVERCVPYRLLCSLLEVSTDSGDHPPLLEILLKDSKIVFPCRQPAVPDNESLLAARFLAHQRAYQRLLHRQGSHSEPQVEKQEWMELRRLSAALGHAALSIFGSGGAVYVGVKRVIGWSMETVSFWHHH